MKQKKSQTLIESLQKELKEREQEINPKQHEEKNERCTQSKQTTGMEEQLTLEHNLDEKNKEIKNLRDKIKQLETHQNIEENNKKKIFMNQNY